MRLGPRGRQVTSADGYSASAVLLIDQACGTSHQFVRLASVSAIQTDKVGERRPHIPWVRLAVYCDRGSAGKDRSATIIRLIAEMGGRGGGS